MLEQTHVQVRNNVMVALSDLCMQWTALVDAHIPRLASCMGDPNEIVRRQGLALLANLLLKVSHSHFCVRFHPRTVVL